jgi:hypothetical protein
MEKSKRNMYIVIAVVAAVVISFLIPMSYYDGSIPKGRAVSDGVIVSEADSSIIVQIYNASADGNSRPTGTYIVLQGDIMDRAHEGQSVQIGYSKDGLYEDTSQKVAIAYEIDSNAFFWLLNKVMPFATAKDLKIIDLQSDGTLLTYYVAN